MFTAPQAMALNLKQGLFLYEEEEEEEQLKRVSAAEEASADEDSGDDNSTGGEDDEEEEEDFYEDEEEEAAVTEGAKEDTPIDPKPVPALPEESTQAVEDIPKCTSPPTATDTLPTTPSSPAPGPRNLLLTSYLNRPLKKKEDVASSCENITPTEPKFSSVKSDGGDNDVAAVDGDPAPPTASPQPSPPPSPPLGAAAVVLHEEESSEGEEDIEFLTAIMERGVSTVRENEAAQIFDRASRDSFEGDDIIRPDEEEMEVAAEEDAEDDEDDVFTPSVPIEEQYFIQEKKAAASVSASANFMTKRFLSELPVNDEEYSSLPPPSKRRRSLSVETEELTSATYYDEVSPQQPPHPPSFPPPQYTFNSASTKVEDEEDNTEAFTAKPLLPLAPAPPPLSTAASPLRPVGLLDKSAANISGAATKRKELLDRVKKTALSIKIKMLDEQTAGMHCNELVKVLFGGDGEEMRTPSLKMRQKLRLAIDAELTVKRFMEYKSVVDINTAELFMKDKNALEDISRQHIMSNPLLSSINLDSIIPGLDDPPAPQHQRQQQQDEVMSLLGDEDSASSDKAPAPAPPAIVSPPQVSLYQDLTEILRNPALNTDPATRLSARIAFLKKMLAYKIGNMCNVSKMIGLTSFIVKQAINTIAGGAGSDRVLLSNGGANNSNTVDDNLSVAGIDLLFGTIKGGVNGVVERTCVSVARLAMYMGVPVVMLNWPNEFKSSPEYENILRDSIIKFKNTSNVSLAFILDTVFGDEEQEDEYGEEDVLEEEELAKIRKEKEPRLDLNEFITSKEKAAIIRDSINNGTASARDMFSAFYKGSATMLSRKGEEYTSTVAAPEIFFKNVTAVIEQKNRVTDNMLGGLVNGLENNKVILSKIISRLIARASLAATMYYINSSSSPSSSKKPSNTNKDNRPLPSSSSKGDATRQPSDGEGSSGLSRLEKRRLLTSSYRRRRPVRSVLRTNMPVIAPPQRILSEKQSKGPKYGSLDSEEHTDTDSLTPTGREAYRDWYRGR